VGLAEVDSSGRITGFREKANSNRPVSTGTYLLETGVFPYIEKFNPFKNKVDLPGDVFPEMLRENQPVSGYVADYEWWDIGKLSDYDKFTHMPPQQAQFILYDDTGVEPATRSYMCL
jgi:mannose-1-phosphate guanylyltransferase